MSPSVPTLVPGRAWPPELKSLPPGGPPERMAVDTKQRLLECATYPTAGVIHGTESTQEAVIPPDPAGRQGVHHHVTQRVRQEGFEVDPVLGW